MNTTFAKSILALSVIFNTFSINAEDNYSIQKDENLTEYTAVEVDDNRYMWISSTWIRSLSLENWTEATDSSSGSGYECMKSSSTLLVHNGTIYIDGSYDSTSDLCTFQCFDAKTGEQLSPIEIDFSAMDAKPTYGFITLRKDDAGTVYMTSACSTDNKTITIYTIDLANATITKSYSAEAKSVVFSNYENFICYPIVTGDISNGNFSIWATICSKIYQWAYSDDSFSYKAYDFSGSFSCVYDAETTLTPYGDDGFIIDASKITPIYYKKDGDTFVTTYSNGTTSYPLSQSGTGNGIYYFTHSGIDMLVYSPVMKFSSTSTYPHYYRVLYVKEQDPTKWEYISSADDDSGATGNIVDMWDVANFGNKTNSLKMRLNLAQSVNNGANSDLYIYTAGIGLAAYNIIGPGSTVLESPSTIAEDTYSIIGNSIVTTSLCNIDVYDIHGRHIVTKTDANSISLSGLSKGIYIVRLSNFPQAIKMAVK